MVTHDNRTLGYADRIVHIEDGALRDGGPVAIERPEPNPWAFPHGRPALAFK